MTSKEALNKLRDTAKYLNDYQATQVNTACDELDKFKALLNKYEIKDIETLEEIIKDYDDMAKSLIQYALGIEIEVKS